MGTWALVLVGVLAALAAVATYKKIGAQTQFLAAQTEAIEHEVRTMREQWEDEHAVRLDFVPVTAADLALGEPPHVFGGVGFRVWNYGRHALRIVGFEFLAPGGGGSVWPRDLLLRSEDADTLVYTEPLIRLFMPEGSALDLAQVERLAGHRFVAAVHYRGIAGQGKAEVEFFVTCIPDPATGAHRFSATVPGPALAHHVRAASA
ncbi:MAG: hypothetical protein ACRD1E_00650 [Terriglobales bacterium]